MASKANISPIAAIALQVALMQLGESENPKGSNKGPMVDKFLKAVGLNPGFAWCQAFVNWAYEQAAKELVVSEPVINTGGVLDCWNRTSPSRKLLRADILKDPTILLPGDQFIMKIGTKGVGHTGLVIACHEGVIHTIEGNTNDDGSREGYEVAIRQRKLSMPELLGVIRY